MGDDRFSNFQGIVYRGFKVLPEQVARYREIATLEDVGKRSFNIPLGLCSTSTDLSVAEEFIKDFEPDEEALIWKIHVHGIDPSLMQIYLDRYPDSVVSSIYAMPVARLSSFAEREILLRGAFFQAIGITSGVKEGRPYHVLEMATINANRDRTSEQASNEAEKATQRLMVRHMATASRLEVCAGVSQRNGSAEDARRFKKLQLEEHTKLETLMGRPIQRREDLVYAASQGIATWFGATTRSSFPTHYAAQRIEWQDAIESGQWTAALDVLKKGYDWNRADWFNIPKVIVEEGPAPERQGFTALHDLAFQGSTDDEGKEAWNELVQIATGPGVYRSVRSFDSDERTAFEVAKESGHAALAERFRPANMRLMPSETLVSLERQLHDLFRSRAGGLLQQTGFRLPQLAMMLELETPELWVPIPHMVGGFKVQLMGEMLEVEVIETVRGRSQPLRSFVSLKSPARPAA